MLGAARVAPCVWRTKAAAPRTKPNTLKKTNKPIVVKEGRSTGEACDENAPVPAWTYLSQARPRPSPHLAPAIAT
eukprot:4628783-Prorocentrum_lima.AAC.1